MKKRMILFIVVFNILFQFSWFIQGAIPASERSALIALFNSTNGDSWKNNSGWKTPPLHTDGFAMLGTEGSWYGVTLSGDNVIALKLPENQLKGFIPKQLGDLSKLEYLDLLRNHLRGGIPLRLDEIKSLKYFFVDSDQPGYKQTEEDILINYSKAGLPDLTPYQPAGWGDKIVVTNTKGQTTDDKIYVNQLAYISYAAKNIGTADITGGFYVNIEVDGIQLPSCPAYWSSPLLADYYFRNFDHIFPTATTAGPHLIKIILDCTNSVYESNEINNEYSRIIQVYPVLPTITTNSVSSITSISAVCGGIISLDGGTPVTARGVCWSTSSNPTTSNSKTTDGSGTGSFTSSISGLNPSTIYYVRAYATNSVGTAYGLEWNFTTPPLSTTVPTVTTNSVYSITSNSAYCGGNVTSDGGATVTTRGVCWSISSNPTINNSKTYDGSGIGSFTSYISGLNPGTTYYVNAYATNSNGTDYGSDVSFTTNPTSPTIPTVSTNAVSSITSNSAVCGGNVTSDGGSTVTARGVCWSTSTNPTTSNSKTIDGTGLGSFTSNITGLSASTKYYVRAYATNSIGTSYGSISSFTTHEGTSSGLIVYFPFNGNSNDESGNGNHADAYGNASLTTDRFDTPNRAFYFDGDHDYLQTVSSSTLQVSTNLTFTAWVNLNSKGSNHSISVQGTISDTTGNWQIYIDTNGRIMIGENNNSYPVGISTGSITWNNWHFIGVTFSSGVYKFYIDGLYDSTSISGLPSFNTTSDGIKIGEREYYPDIDDTKGKLDEIRIYNKTLSASEIQSIYLLGSSTPTVTTNAVSSITSSSAVCGGNVTSDGGSTVTTRGVCWSTSLNPTINNPKTIDGSGAGSFTSYISGLSASTIYHFRAYATNSIGTSYGSNISFTTYPAPTSIPTVTTNSVTSITSTSAVCGGNVTSDGGSTVTARGVCWSTSSNPTISNSKTIDGSGTGTFTSYISGLNPSTIYYVRAYATNSNGTSYGANVNFTTNTTSPTIPAVATNSVSSITSTSAVCGGNVTSDGGSTVTARGVCWGTSLNPTTNNSKTTDGSGTGSFTSNISGLNPSTMYHVRAYATNNNGTAYGTDISFVTAGGTTQSLKVGNLTFFADSISQSGNVYTLSGNVNIDQKLWFSDNIIYTAGSSTSGTLLSAGYPFVKLSKGNQYIFTVHDLVYNVNGDTKKLTPLTGSADYFYAVYFTGIPLGASTDPIFIREDGVLLSGKITIGTAISELCAVEVEVLLKPGDKIYLEKASLSLDTSSLIPGIKVTSIRLDYNGEKDELTGSATLEFSFLGLKEIEAAISVQPGCIDGFRIAVALKKSIKLGTTGLSIDGFTLEVDNICTPARFKIFFGGDLGIVGISPEVFLLEEMGLGYEHPFRLNLEGGTVKFLEYPVAHLSGYIDASNDINKAGAGIYGNIDFGEFYVAEIDLKLLTKLLKFNGSANGVLQIPDFDCDNFKCKVIKTLISTLIGHSLPYEISKQEMDIEIWKNNGNWTGSLKGMTTIFGIQFAAELSYANGKLHFSIGRNFDDMLKIFRNTSEYTVLANSVEQSITLPSTMESILFSAVGNTKLPLVYLKTPAGEVISPGNVGSFTGVTYIENENTKVSLFMLNSAAAGKWTIGVSNLSSSEVNFEILAKRILPKTSFSQVTRTGTKFNIKANLTPAKSDITVSLYFSERSAGGTGNLIAENLNAASGTVSTIWETSAISTGTYYIYAKTYDNLNAPVLTYYDSAIVIDNNGIQAPQNLSGTASGETVELTWTPSQNPSVAGYKVLYTDEPNIGGYKYQKGTILNNQATIGGLTLNKAYRFCVVAFDENGNLSKESSTYTTTGTTGTPEISLAPGTFHFGGTPGGIKTGSRILLVSNKGSGSLNWTVSTNQNWLDCTPTSGTGNGTVTVSVDPTGIAAGTYTGTITVSDPKAANSPQTAAVTLNVYNSNQTSEPFGDFATPIDGSTVSSSIAVTGWVLDDVGLSSVKIYNGNAYIGDAVFVEGARPDIEQSYPTYPDNYKAGWGYMLLTNFLPNNGNGTFTLHAIATDMEGNQVTLGTKTIIVDNLHAVKPFGAIDTPGQGGIASDSAYRNWGWVLTPQPNQIPSNGTTIDVWLDGIKQGHPTYNIYRSDVASLFPGYANSNGAAGYFDLNTTTFANGVHSIFWTATDSGGNSDGIGSRYFLVQNTGSSRVSATDMRRTFTPGYKDLIEIPISCDAPVKLIRGYTEGDIPEEVTPDSEGIAHIQTRELERIEVQVSQAGQEVEGFMIVGNRLLNLPIGSTLDRKTGRFSWIPGPGFIGAYRLVFVEIDREGVKSRKDLLVTIGPKFIRE